MPIQCILCGGDHEPSGPKCMANEEGLDKQIAKLGAQKWNKLSAQTMRVYSQRLRTLASEDAASVPEPTE